MTDAAHLMEVVQRVADSLERPADLAGTRERLAHAARDAVPEAGFASLTIRDTRTGTIETCASTDDLLYEIDRLQYELGEGPCFEAVTDGELAIAADLRTDPRWPHFGPRAAQLGMLSQLGIRLRQDDQVVGLNLYATRPDAFHEPLDDVRLIASQARSILGYARLNESLSRGMISRTVIGEAIGIVMERYQLDEDRAFHFLVRVSQQSNVKLRDVARSIVHPPAAGSPDI